MSFDTIPKDLRGLRACLVCSLIKVSNKIQLKTEKCIIFMRKFKLLDNGAI